MKHSLGAGLSKESARKRTPPTGSCTYLAGETRDEVYRDRSW